MRIGQFLEYKGFIGSIELDFKDKIHFGQILNIDDLVSYHADNIIDLHEQFHLAVDNYIEFRNKVKKA